MAIVLPLERLKVGEFIAATFGHWHNMVDFPAHIACGSVAGPGNNCPSGILAVFCGVPCRHDRGFVPDFCDCGIVECATADTCVRISQ